MRNLPGYARGGSPQIEVSSWLGSKQMAVLPVVSHSWKVADEVDVKVPGSVEFAVPNEPEWRPLTPDHPLARFGQQLRVRVNERGEWVTLGRYRLIGCTPSGGVLQVRGLGLLHILERARLMTSLQTGWVTKRAALDAIVGGLLPLSVTAWGGSLPPRLWEPQTSRLAAFWELLESWPARAYVDDLGVLCVAPPFTEGVPLYTIAEGVDLSEIEPVPDDRDPFNAYVVSTQPEGGAAPLSVSWGITSGPMSYYGPYGLNPGFYSSPLLPDDRSVLEDIARTMTQRQVRQAHAVDFTVPFDPRMEAGDQVRVTSPSHGIDGTGRIVSIAHDGIRTSGRVGLA